MSDLDLGEPQERAVRGTRVNALLRRLESIGPELGNLTPAQRARLRPALVAAVEALDGSR